MKYLSSIRRLLAWLRPMQIPLHSTYTAFYLILSLFPCMLLLLGLLKYTPFGVKELLDLLEGLLPETLLPAAEAVVHASYQHSSGAVVSLSAVAALWSASRGMRGLAQGLDAVYGCQESPGYFRSRGLSMIYTLIFLLVLVATLLVQVFFSDLTDFLLMTTAPALLEVLGSVDVEFFILLGLLTCLFSIMYAWLPAKNNPIGKSVPGGFAAALGWLVLAEAFSVYVNHFASYTNIYGSLYGLALGMLWLYVCISLIFYCGVLNRILSQKKWQK